MAKMKKKERTNVSVPAEVHSKFKAKCALLGVTQREVLTRMLRDWTSDLPDYEVKEGENDATRTQ